VWWLRVSLSGCPHPIDMCTGVGQRSVGKKANRLCGLAKYALHSDTDFTGCASAKAGIISNNHQCVAHVLRRGDLLFSSGVRCSRTACPAVLHDYGRKVRINNGAVAAGEALGLSG